MFFMGVHKKWSYLHRMVLTVECGLWTSDLRVLHNITGKIKEDNYGANYN